MTRGLANNGGRVIHFIETKELNDEKKFKIGGCCICFGNTCDGC